MGEFGPASLSVNQLIEQARGMALDDAADLYHAQAARILIQGPEAERQALTKARRAAAVAGLQAQYEHARHAAVTSWRHNLPETQGPWLVVGHAIANAAGALVVADFLDLASFQLLVGPWRQAFGLVPVGPGMTSRHLVNSR
jgi:hypothetical protein